MDTLYLTSSTLPYLTLPKVLYLTSSTLPYLKYFTLPKVLYLTTSTLPYSSTLPYLKYFAFRSQPLKPTKQIIQKSEDKNKIHCSRKSRTRAVRLTVPLNLSKWRQVNKNNVLSFCYKLFFNNMPSENGCQKIQRNNHGHEGIFSK